MQYELLTHKGIGAIAVVSLRGKKTELDSFLRKHFRTKRKNVLLSLPENKNFKNIEYGFFADENGEPLDEILLVKIDDTHFEIQFHGSIGVAERLVELLENAGVKRVASANEITKLFVSAKTETEAKLIASQFANLQACALRTLQLLEKQDCQSLKELSQKILANKRIVSFLKKPLEVFILGKPNVGKSTLLNKLAGFNRALVSPVPGTTRDIVEQLISINGFSVKFCDAAGVRKTSEFIEKRAVVQTLQQAKRADLILFLLDATTGITDIEKPILEKLGSFEHLLVVNKIDVGKKIEKLEALEISAKTGTGIKILTDKIAKKLRLPTEISDIVLPFSAEIEQIFELLAKCNRLSQIEIRLLKEKLEKIPELARINVL